MPDITKSGVRALVEAGDETAILSLFDEDPHRVQRFLKRLACAPDAAYHARTVACFLMLSRERSARMVASHPAASASEAEGSSRSAAGPQQQLFSNNAKEPAPAAARTVVFLAAPPGAGKSTLAAVLERLAQSQPGMPRVQAVGMDGFHHTNAYLDCHTLDCPDGKPVPLRSIKGAPETFDVEGLARALHETRVSSDSVHWPAYSRVAHDVVADGPLVSAPIVIVEGNYLLLDESPWRDLAELCDLSIFVEADEAMLRERLVARKVHGGLARTEAERFFEQSDGKNVRRVLAHRCPADITLTLDSSGRMRRLKAIPALAFFDIDGTLTWAREGEADIDAAPTDAVRLALEWQPRRALHGPAAVQCAAGAQDVAVCRHGHVGGRARGARR